MKVWLMAKDVGLLAFTGFCGYLQFGKLCTGWPVSNCYSFGIFCLILGCCCNLASFVLAWLFVAWQVVGLELACLFVHMVL